MPKFKNITEVPEATEVKETDKVLLNVDGKAMQANAGLIKPKEDHLYIKAELKEDQGGPDGSPPPSQYFSLLETNVTYSALLEGIKTHSYPPISLEFDVQDHPGGEHIIPIKIISYGMIQDATDIGGGIMIMYDSFALLEVIGILAIVAVKPDNTVEFLRL